MSRLPTLSTPGRPVNGSPMGSGIPTPASRRPRSSLGPTQPKQSDAEMDQALKDLLRRRPPSSLGRDDPDTPTQVPSSYMAPERSMQTPRTPGLRPKTPSSLATPTSRPTSRPSLVGRPSLSSSTTTPRRPSMAASTSTTPAYRRPESRAGTYDPKWAPAVGDRVRLPQHGYEGTLRYLGETHNREGTWAGVELEGGFRGKGRNDGSVDGYVVLIMFRTDSLGTSTLNALPIAASSLLQKSSLLPPRHLQDLLARPRWPHIARWPPRTLRLGGPRRHRSACAVVPQRPIKAEPQLHAPKPRRTLATRHYWGTATPPMWLVQRRG